MTTSLGSLALEFIRPVSPPFAEGLLERFGAGAAPALTGLAWPGSDERFAADADLLAALESARSPAERRRLFHKLTKFSDPEVVVETAFSEYDRTGREAFLLHAVSILEAFGKQGWPALLRVAQSGRAETELFLGLIARCPGVNSDERSDAFRLLSKYAPPSARLALLEHLASLGPEREQHALREIAERDPEDTVRTEASLRLSTFTGSDF